MGDISFLLTRRFGRINDTSLTEFSVSPTGKWDATCPTGRSLPQPERAARLSAARRALSSSIARIDQVWGVAVVGAVSQAWRGGENKLNSYRAPTARGLPFLARISWNRSSPGSA